MSTIATMIRDAAFTRLLGIFDWKSTRKIPVLPVQASMMPCLGAFVLRESYSPLGDANVGPPSYIVDAMLGFSVTDLSSDSDVLEGSIDTKIDLILNTLLCDGTFIDLRDENGNPVIDSIGSITRTYNYPSEGETNFCECRLQMTFRFFCYFEPNAPNLLRDVVVDVKGDGAQLSDGTPLEIELTG